MKRIIFLIFAVSLIAAACKSPPPPPAPEPPPPGLENPGFGPALSVEIPELFSPDPDIENDTMTIAISVDHPVPIRNWELQIQPNRGQAAQAAQNPAAETGTRANRRQSGQEQPRRRVFYELSGYGLLPEKWEWDGRGTSGEMVQSAMQYRFTLSANDVFGNNSVYEGMIDVDVLVRREGDNLRIIVPSIIFPGNEADLNSTRLSDEERSSNARIMRLIARALNRFEEYEILVEGHANPETPPNTTARNNEEVRQLKPLSEDRAKAVMNHLIANNNIAADRLTSTGKGGIETVADYSDPEENWKNRRVEFILKR